MGAGGLRATSACTLTCNDCDFSYNYVSFGGNPIGSGGKITHTHARACTHARTCTHPRTYLHVLTRTDTHWHALTRAYLLPTLFPHTHSHILTHFHTGLSLLLQSTATLTRTTITHNYAHIGAGVYATAATLTLHSCTVSHNVGAQGVGLNIFYSGNTYMNNVTISNNTRTDSSSLSGVGMWERQFPTFCEKSNFDSNFTFFYFFCFLVFGYFSHMIFRNSWKLLIFLFFFSIYGIYSYLRTRLECDSTIK